MHPDQVAQPQTDSELLDLPNKGVVGVSDDLYLQTMLTPLPLANALLVFASTLFAMSLASGIALFVVHSLLGLMLAGQLVGAATPATERSVLRWHKRA